jgi:rhamnose transport system permease protein
MLVLLAVGQAVVILTSQRGPVRRLGPSRLTAYLTGASVIDVAWHPSIVWSQSVLVDGGLPACGTACSSLSARVPGPRDHPGHALHLPGVVLTWAGSDRVNASDLPRDFLALGTRSILGIPVLFLVALGVLAAVGYYLHFHRGGRELYAIGSDPEAAELYGLQVRRRILSAFVLSGALAGLAGVLYTARYGTVSSGAGTGIELQAVAAVVIGGVAIFGGSGTVWGAALGAVLLVTINRALPILGIPDFWQRAVVGALILGSIVLDRVLAARRARRLVEARDAS